MTTAVKTKFKSALRESLKTKATWPYGFNCVVHTKVVFSESMLCNGTAINVLFSVCPLTFSTFPVGPDSRCSELYGESRVFWWFRDETLICKSHFGLSSYLAHISATENKTIIKSNTKCVSILPGLNANQELLQSKEISYSWRSKILLFPIRLIFYVYIVLVFVPNVTLNSLPVLNAWL